MSNKPKLQIKHLLGILVIKGLEKLLPHNILPAITKMHRFISLFNKGNFETETAPSHDDYDAVIRAPNEIATVASLPRNDVPSTVIPRQRRHPERSRHPEHRTVIPSAAPSSRAPHRHPERSEGSHPDCRGRFTTSYDQHSSNP